jgi:hypothetical protein
VKTELYPWQQDIFDKITSGGFKPGELTIMMAGRQLGKSTFTQQAIDRLMRDLNSQPITDLVLSEGTVYGNRYHCVEPVGGNWREMEAWCGETYGTHGGAIWGQDPNKAPLPNERWYMNNRKFWFRNEKDRTMFIMRWSR